MRQSALTILGPARLTAEQLETRTDLLSELGRELDACRNPDGKTECPGASDLRSADGDLTPTAHTPARAVGDSMARGIVGKLPDVKPDLRVLLDTGRLHYMSFFLVPAHEGETGYVGLELNVDGSVGAWRALLSQRGTFLGQLFRGCDGLDATPTPRQWAKFLKRNTRRPNAFFVAFPGRDVKQILGEQDLRLRARSAFEKAARISGTLNKQPADDSSPREAPSSASAMWEYVRNRFKNVDLVKRGVTRPWYVRWGIEMGGLQENLNLWGNRLFVGLAVLTAAVWLATSGYAHGYAATAVLGALVLTGALTLFAWWREAPRTLNARGRWRVSSNAVWAWLSSWMVWTVSLGTMGMVARLGFRLAQALTSYQAVIGLALAVSATVVFLLGRLGLRPALSGFLFLLFVDIASVVPVASLPRFLSATIGGLGVFVIAPVAAFVYVMEDLLAAVLSACALVAAWSFAFWHWRDAPIPLGIVGCLSAAAMLALCFAWAAFWLAAVRHAEERENAKSRFPEMPSIMHLNKVQAREDQELQNHLTVVSLLKDEPDRTLRLRTLQRVLRAVSLATKIYANQGDLGGIRTIHFAQFIILESPKGPKNGLSRLLFLSNYDAAFGSYLQDFNTVTGVTAVWSNCKGFPASFGLVSDGANDEQLFKQFGRRDQVPSLGWFSRYPSLFIHDIDVATKTRETLRRPLDNPTTWVGRRRAQFGQPLTEADCDAALQQL
jgi:hypothetical protein